MQIFARLTKVNEADRTVEGVIASEAVDRSGEVFDYDKSKPHFLAWSDGIAKATDGKNLGNVRVMHGKTVAGVTKQIDFDDADKRIAVKAEIVDDNEWNKVLKGCYSGFSIGGKYGSKWEDPVLKAQRYEAIPSEYSLVDLPCNPEAEFTVIKADGSQELRKFETAPEGGVAKIDDAHEPAGSPEGGEFAPTEGEGEPEHKKMSAKEHRKAAFDHENQATREERAGNEEAATAHRTAADAHEYAASLKSKRDPNADWKSKKAQHWTHLANSESNKAGNYRNPVEIGKAAEAQEVEKIAERSDVDPKVGEDKYGDVEYADEKNKKYPLDSEKHIRAAWSYIHMPKNAGKYDAADVGTIKRKIIAAWKAKVDSKGPPDAEKFAGFGELLAKAVADDDQDSIAHISEVIASMTTENDDLEKVGRKHTRAMREHRKMMAHHLDEAKKHLDAMAADDPANDPDDDGDDDAEKLAKASGDLAKVTSERDDLKKQLDEINAAAAELKKQLEAQPLPPKGVVTAVDKTVGLPSDKPADPQPVLKADGSIDHLATATELAKAIYRKG